MRIVMTDKRFLVFGVFVFFSTTVLSKTKTITHTLVFSDTQPTRTLTMAHAVQAALEHRPDLQAFYHRVQASKMLANQAWSGFLPQVNFTSIQSKTKGIGSSQNTTLLRADQLVYSFAGPQELYRRAKKATEVVEFLHEQAQKTVRFEVEKAFLESWLLQNQHHAFAALKQSAEQSYDKIVHQNKLELLNKSEYLKGATDYATNLSSVYSYADDINIAQRKLEFLMGKPLNLELNIHQNTGALTTTKLHWDHETMRDIEPLTVYHQYGIKYRPELKQSERKIAIEKDSVRIANNTRLPDLSVFATTEHVPSDPIIQRKGLHTIGATVHWNVFDGLLSHYQSNEAHANMMKEILEHQQLVNVIKSEIETAYYTLSKTITQQKAQHVAYTQAKNDFELKKQQLEIGDISRVEFTTAKTDWQNAQYAWINSQLDVAIKERNLLFVCGYPPELENA